MGQYFLNFFRNYQTAVMQATTVLPSSHYLLGADPTGACVRVRGFRCLVRAACVRAA